MKITAGIFIGFCVFGLMSINNPVPTEIKNYTLSWATDTVFLPPIDPPLFKVTGTIYHPVASQCDSTPLRTADGSYIDTMVLAGGKLRWIALSQDLLWFNDGPYRYGDRVYIHSEKNQIRGWWTVHDCMAERFTRHVDFLQMPGGNIPGRSRHLIISNKEL